MARAVVALLVFMMGAAAARNNDYLGSHMPNYGSDYESKDRLQPSDEYPERSPDAALPLDYKYEEDEHIIHDSKPHMKHIESNAWVHGPKNKPLKYSKDEDIDHDEYENDKNSVKARVEHVASKFRQNSRPRNKHNYYDSDIDDKSLQHSHRRNNDEYSIDSREKINAIGNRGREGSRAIYGKPNNRFQRRENTGRKPRRKPRDRDISREVLSDTNENKEEVINSKEEESMEEDYPARRITIDIENPKPKKPPFRKNNPEYDEYFDMKRISRIKEKFITSTSSQTTKVSASETAEKLKDNHPSKQWPNRRANVQQDLKSDIKVTKPSTSLKTKSIKSTLATTLILKSTGTPEPPINKTALSLAEKSRLSIMKKAQKKENMKNLNLTTKPPVLMQVTQRMQTLVMVERRNQKDTNVGPKEILEDSPERVARARQLMRHKLVAGARNIQDLTDNWDEMICDYIDTSLLNSGVVQCFYHIRYLPVLLLCFTWLRFLQRAWKNV